MKRALRLILAALFILILMLALAPAAWMDTILGRASGGLVGLADAKGTLWRGGGVIQAVLPTGEVDTVAPVRWTLGGWGMLKGNLNLNMLSERDGRPVLDAVLTPTGVSVSELRLDLPAALLGAASPTLREAGLAGRLSLRTNEFRLESARPSGTGELIWRNAGSSLTPVYPLGTYTIRLTGTPDGLSFKVSSAGGALGLNGDGAWRLGAAPTLNVLAVPAPEQARELTPLLRLIGKRTEGDTYRLQLDANTGLARQQ